MYFQGVDQFLCHIISGFERNHMKIKKIVKIENMSNQGYFLLLKALASFVKVRLPTHFARSGHTYTCIYKKRCL